MTAPKCTSVGIAYSKVFFDPEFINGSARAIMTFDDGTIETFYWFHDEITFTEGDFVGHTMDEVRETFRRRDLAWLSS